VNKDSDYTSASTGKLQLPKYVHQFPYSYLWARRFACTPWSLLCPLKPYNTKERHVKFLTTSSWSLLCLDKWLCRYSPDGEVETIPLNQTPQLLIISLHNFMQGVATQGWHLLNSAQNGSLSMGIILRQDNIMLWAKSCTQKLMSSKGEDENNVLCLLTSRSTLLHILTAVLCH